MSVSSTFHPELARTLGRPANQRLAWAFSHLASLLRDSLPTDRHEAAERGLLNLACKLAPDLRPTPMQEAG